MDRPYPTSLTFTPTPLEVAKSSIVAPIILNVFVTTNTSLLQLDNIIEEYLEEGAVICKAVPFAINFFWYELVLPYIGKHSNPVNGFVGGVEICLH
jgi:hypothetical protein